MCRIGNLQRNGAVLSRIIASSLGDTIGHLSLNLLRSNVDISPSLRQEYVSDASSPVLGCARYFRLGDTASTSPLHSAPFRRYQLPFHPFSNVLAFKVLLSFAAKLLEYTVRSTCVSYHFTQFNHFTECNAFRTRNQSSCARQQHMVLSTHTYLHAISVPDGKPAKSLDLERVEWRKERIEIRTVLTEKRPHTERARTPLPRVVSGSACALEGRAVAYF